MAIESVYGTRNEIVSEILRPLVKSVGSVGRGRGRSLAPAGLRLGRGLRGLHAFAHGDDVRAVLTADLQDLAANSVVTDRVAGLAAVAQELHAHDPRLRTSRARGKRAARRDTRLHCAEKLVE